jgi:outer membrane protein
MQMKSLIFGNAPRPNVHSTKAGAGGGSTGSRWRGLTGWSVGVCCAGVALAGLEAAAADSGAQGREITLEQAIQMALESNLDVQIQRFEPMISQFNLSSSLANYYEPQLGFNVFHSFRSQPGGVDEFGRDVGNREVETDSFGGQPFIQGNAPSGLSYSVQASTSGTSASNPGFPDSDVYSGDWRIQVSQPLLRDALTDSGRVNIKVNKKLLKISELGLVNQIMATVSRVEQAYYNLIAARENVTVVETALELAETTLTQNRKKVEVGTLAMLDEKEAESQVATSKADLISAQRNLAVQENVLKGLLTDDFAALQSTDLVPAEKLIAVPVALDLQESWRLGLSQRPDLQQAKLDLERMNITLKYQKNQLLPQLDLVGSYGQSGFSGGGGPFAPTPSYSRAFSSVGQNDNPSYTIGTTLSVPLGNFGPRARHKAAQAQSKQTILQLKQLEQDIMIQIDDAVKRTQASFDRIEATRQARLFAEAAWKAEQQKLDNGKSTSFLVLQFQQRLTAARFSEISALAEYNIALSQLAVFEGSTLEKHRLNVNFE